MENDIYVSIRKVPGGYILETGDGTSIQTSLNKAMAVVKDLLTPEVGSTPDVE